MKCTNAGTGCNLSIARHFHLAPYLLSNQTSNSSSPFHDINVPCRCSIRFPSTSIRLFFQSLIEDHELLDRVDLPSPSSLGFGTGQGAGGSDDSMDIDRLVVGWLVLVVGCVVAGLPATYTNAPVCSTVACIDQLLKLI